MGLAAKLQAADQQQQQQYGGSGYGQQGGYAPSGAYAHSQQGGYGQQPNYQSPPQGQLPGVDVNSIQQRLSLIIQQNGLHSLYPQQRLQSLASEIVRKDLQGLAFRWRLPPNLVLDLVALALYDIVIMADDSGSMKLAENGERIKDLEAMLSRIADASSLFDSDGISVRFMNSSLSANNLRNAQEIQDFVKRAQFGGLTPMGTMLEKKLILPFVTGPAQNGALRKPVLVIVITDGEPVGESSDAVRSAIKTAKKVMSNSRYGAGAVAFQFAQVGRDAEATKFLGKLDTDSKIGGMVDATSYIELEQEEYRKKGIDLTVDLYMVKLLVGAIDSSYDEQDEVKKAKKKGLLGGLFK